MILTGQMPLAGVVDAICRQSWTGRVLVLDGDDLDTPFEDDTGTYWFAGHIDPLDALGAVLLLELDAYGLKEVASSGLLQVDDVDHVWVLPVEGDHWFLVTADAPGGKPFTRVTGGGR